MSETSQKIHIGDAATILRTYPDRFFQLMFTSPPYWNVRDYGHEGQIGLNDTLDEYLNRLKEVWQEVVRTQIPT